MARTAVQGNNPAGRGDMYRLAGGVYTDYIAHGFIRVLGMYDGLRIKALRVRDWGCFCLKSGFQG